MTKPTIRLEVFDTEWSEDDPDANFKREVAEYTRIDPLPTFEQLSRSTGIPLGALVRFALVRWAADGSESLLQLGPTAVRRLASIVEEAEATGTDAARLAGYERLRGLIGWMAAPLDEQG